MFSGGCISCHLDDKECYQEDSKGVQTPILHHAVTNYISSTNFPRKSFWKIAKIVVLVISQTRWKNLGKPPWFSPLMAKNFVLYGSALKDQVELHVKLFQNDPIPENDLFSPSFKYFTSFVFDVFYSISSAIYILEKTWKILE